MEKKAVKPVSVAEEILNDLPAIPFNHVAFVKGSEYSIIESGTEHFKAMEKWFIDNGFNSIEGKKKEAYHEAKTEA